MNSTSFLNLSPLRGVALAAAIMGGSFTASADQQPLTGADKTTAEQAAMNVINDFIGDATFSVTVNVDLGKTDDGKDRFSYNYDGELTIHASSGVAACRAFYDFAKSNNAGVYQWSGKRFVAPTDVTKSSQPTFTSPYRDHQYFNVVTYGYTTPYWDEDRWDKEINWMALHGVDMPLMLVGSEAVYRKVFKNLYNLSDADIQAWEVGPAHLPWFRMGNLSGQWFDGPLGQHWYDRQEQLAKHILKRMRELGMKPVCPAFGGFVPGALQNKVSGVEKVGWSWCKNGPAANYRLGPSSEDFVTIGTEFIKEWERTYGECKYYLSDSFNEMKVPDDLTELTGYGDNIFKCINDGSSCDDAVWVTQGWTFVYQAGEWGKDKFNALTANVPKGRFNMLYMSPEYGNGKWNSPYEGFNGHDWTITMLPNMGGKNFYNGGLTTYADSWRKQYTGTNCANLTGWGMTPEGVENNEMIYEMICDAGWTPASQNLDVNNWKSQYAYSRYGQYDDDIQNFYNTLQSTVLSSYQDHRSFGWQGYNKTNNYNEGRINPGKTFFEGMEAFLSKENLAKYKDDCPDLLRYDIIEAAAFYAGCRVELLNKRIKIANDAGDKAKALQLVDSLEVLMTQMDRVLTAHPLYDEAKWEAKAAKMAEGRDNVSDGGQATRDKYVKNARCITSVWHGNHGTNPDSHEPVNDYACRVWAGLIRDYYMPRLAAEWRARINKESVNLRTLENAYVPLGSGSVAPPLSTIENDLTNADNAAVFAQIDKLMELAKPLGEVTFQHLTEIKPSNDVENHWYSIRSAGENFNLRVLTATGDNPSVSVSGNLVANEFNGGVNQMWRFIDNGDGTFRIESRNGQSMAYNAATKKPDTRLTNFDTDIRMEFHNDEAKLTDATKDCWGIIPVATNNGNTGYHMNSGQGLMVWNHVNDGKYYADSSWSIEDIANNDETYVEDYTRYAKRLRGFTLWGDPTLVGGAGQPKAAGSVAAAIAALGNYTAGDHESYNDFLKKWNEQILTPHFNVPEAQTPARKLFDALLSVFQTVTPSTSNAAANDALKAAVAAAQATLATGNAEACNAEIANLKEAVNAFLNASAPQKTSTISEGVYMLKNISAARNACLYEEADGKLHLKADVAGQADAEAGYFFTLVADGSNYKIRTAKNQYIPALTQTKSAPGSAHQSSTAEGVAYTFTYNTDHWTIRLASDASKYLYCFGPSYNDGRLLNAGSGDVTDGGKWELYRVPQADSTPSGSINNEWTGTDWQAAAFGNKAAAADKTNFYGACYYDYNSDVTVTETGKVSATLTYESGSHAQGMYGIQLISKDEAAASNARSHRAPSAAGALDDYNFGTVGSSPKTQTYTVNSVPAGTYTLRVWSCATNGQETMTANGKLEVNVNDAKIGENTWEKNSWKIDNSLIPAKVKENANMVKIGVNLNEGNGGTRSYRYLDEEMTFDKATTLTTTVTSSDASKTMEIIGVELLKNGSLVTDDGSFDGHYGTIGATNTNNTYTLAIPAAGTYTVRVWASYVRNEVAAAGAATYDVPQNTLPLTKVEGIWVAPSLLESGAFADNTVWYTIKNYQNVNGGVYNYMSTADGYMDSDNSIKLSNRTPDATNAGLWCLVGDATNGYKFYNKAMGTDYVLSTSLTGSKGGMVLADDATKDRFSFEQGKSAIDGWFIRDGVSGNQWWNQQGGYLKHWESGKGDNNSTFVFEAVTPLPDVTPDPEDPENNLGAVDNVDASKYPFVLSTSADEMHWHYLTIRGDRYVSYNSGTGKFSNSTTAPTGDAGLFAFVPVSENTVKIVNKALGLTKAIGGTVTNNGLASVVDYANGLEFIYQNNEGHDVFAIKDAADNAHVNDIQNTLGFWVADQSATDDGSTFVFAPTEVLISTDAVKHYYTIRCANPDKSRNTHYAHYAGSNAKLALNANRDNSTVFYFTSAGANEGNFQKVQIHNYTADGLTMNGWDSWAATNPMTWYVRLATGTTDILLDFNIANTMTNIDGDQNACWNYQDVGVFKWKAGNDKGSAWYLEEVKERTYNIVVNGADDASYTLYNNGQAYKNGETITGFFFAANNFTTDPEGQHPFDGVLTTDGDNLVFSFTEFSTITPGERPTDINDYALWYNEPATKTSASDKWMEYALPLGNGQIGATFLGGLMTDNIQFNEKTLWRGGPGRNADGGQGYFQNFGSILVRDLSGAFSASSTAKPATDYARYLDIMNGVGGVRYNSATTQYKRNYFTSAPDKVLVAHYAAEGTDKLELLFSYAPDTQIGASAVTYDGVEATFSGKLHVVKYNTRFRVLSDGDVTRTDDGIKVTNGTYATLVMAAATDYDAAKNGSVTGETAEQLATRVSARLGAAAAKSYDELLAAHVDNFSSLMGRVDIDFGGASDKTTEDLIKFYNQSADNKLSADGLYLEQLYFQYGRYMTIGANNDLSIHAPSNLQGIWNDRSNTSFWHCDVHADINVEMNYWPADPTNLSEMHRPFLDHIIDMGREGGPWEQLTHGNPGWTIDCENNIFGGTSGWSQGNMKTLGAWYCSHLWRYYRYTKDREFLKKALPVMYRNALYLKSISEPDSDGTYVIPGEWSPEHGNSSSTITAFAQQTTAELLDEIIKAHAVLGSESPLTDAEVKVISDFYDVFDKGIQIENYSFNRGGVAYNNVPCISEWKKIALHDPGHRHLSHLMCIYPFEQISAYDNSEEGQRNFEAACNGILARTGDVTGWSMGWQTNVYARCLKGDQARSYLSYALRHSTNYSIAMGGDGGCYYNLFDAHSPFQIDGNYGCTSGVAEMLLQSYDDVIHLLPALPTAWADGHAKGLKAVGNFTVDQTWAAGKLTGADITSNMGGTLRVEYGKKVYTVADTNRGATYHFDVDASGNLTFNLVDASIVTITDYIDGARSGAPYDASVLKQYEDVVLKVSPK